MARVDESEQKLAISTHGFCQILKNGTIRCRETDRAQPSFFEAPPSGEFERIVSYERGYCALKGDGQITCWRNMGSTYQDGVEFPGRYVSIASEERMICALDLQGALWCARPATLKITEERVETLAIRLSEGPYDRLFSAKSICARANGYVDCLFPTSSRSKESFESGLNSPPTLEYVTRIEGDFVTAVRTRESTCGLQVDGQVVCKHAGRYLKPPKESIFTGTYTKLTASSRMCAKRLDTTWLCEDGVEGPTEQMSDILVGPNISHDRIAGLRPDGVLVARDIPEKMRHDFVKIYGINYICAVRADESVFCEYPRYDDDVLQNVTEISASDDGMFTDHGQIGAWLPPEGITHVFGSLDPRNVEVKGFAEVQHGRDFGCGLSDKNDIKCWLTTKWNKKRARPPAKKFKSMALGQVFGCGITQEDEVKCWGDNYFFSVTNQPPGKFREIRTSRLNACAIRDDGQILCWGQAFPTLFEFPFKTKKWVVVSQGVCGVDEARDVQCYGLGFAWSRPDYSFVLKR